MTIHNRGFSKSHIIKTTLYHTKRSVDISIEKCLSKINEHPEKSQDILDTLQLLNSLKGVVVEFEKNLNQAEVAVNETVRREESEA